MELNQSNKFISLFFANALFLLGILICSCSSKENAKSDRPEVIILGLFHLRFDIKGRESMDSLHLTELIKKIKPDIILTEINSEWFNAYKADTLSNIDIYNAIRDGEIGKVFLPLATENNWEIYGIGVESYQESEKEKNAREILIHSEYGQGKLKTWKEFLSIFYDIINKDFVTFETMNNSEYDRLMELKHTFNDSINYHYWIARNELLVKRICSYANKNPGKRIAVAIGAEHGYALRKGIEKCDNITHLTLHEILLKDKN